MEENLKRVAEAEGFDLSKLTDGHQIHKTNILNIDYSHCRTHIEGYDGYITNKPGIVLMHISMPTVFRLFFVDPVK